MYYLPVWIGFDGTWFTTYLKVKGSLDIFSPNEILTILWSLFAFVMEWFFFSFLFCVLCFVFQHDFKMCLREVHAHVDWVPISTVPSSSLAGFVIFPGLDISRGRGDHFRKLCWRCQRKINNNILSIFRGDSHKPARCRRHKTERRRLNARRPSYRPCEKRKNE